MIDLCVVNYNTKDKLQRLVETLRTSAEDFGDNPPWTLYVADNKSTDDSLAMMWRYCKGTPEWNGKDLYHCMMVGLDNIGYARACNRLANFLVSPNIHGKGDIIGLLNADVWLTTQDVLDIEAVFKEHPDVDILGPKQRDEQGYITHGGIFGTLDRPAHRGWKLSDPDDLHYRDNLKAVTVSGSAYFIRRSVWDDLTKCPTYRKSCLEIVGEEPEGAFLPTKHYYEETFCSYHAQEHGYSVWYWGEISIGHSWHASHEVGSPMDQMFKPSQAIFRKACDDHGIRHD